MDATQNDELHVVADADRPHVRAVLRRALRDHPARTEPGAGRFVGQCDGCGWWQPGVAHVDHLMDVLADEGLVVLTIRPETSS